MLINSTNTNPSATYGGTWELIDKSFATSVGSDDAGFTPATNIVNAGTYFSRADHTIRIRQGVTINAALSDTGATLGKFNWSAFGVTAIPFGYNACTAFNDAANGGIMCNITYNTGGISQVDVIDLDSIATGSTFYIDVTFTVNTTAMLDAFCDRFYFKRTA